MPLEFAGAALPLTDDDIAAAAAVLHVESPVIAAVAEVESSGDGFLPDKRPKVLFEAHIFGRETMHRYDRSHPNISSAIWNRALYGAPGAHQYERLHEAIALDRPAALRSASWGRFQIMGFNHKHCGFTTVEAFVAKMGESEAAQLAAFIAFCQSRDLVRFLVTHDWNAFTKGYNGPGQVELYSGQLAEAYRRHAARVRAVQVDRKTAGDPDDNPVELIRRAQRLLGQKDDGDPGPRTRKAVRAYREAHPGA